MKPILLVVIFLCIALASGGVDGRKDISNLDRERAIDEKLKQLNKPAVKTILSENGDIIDCVDINKQPSLDHPLLKNHTIVMKPSDKILKMIQESPTAASAGPLPTQAWQKNGSCPEGTIPILRIQRRYLENAPSIQNYGRKPWHGDGVAINSNPLATNVTLGNLHQSAVLVGEGYSYTGAAANLNLWNPFVNGFRDSSSNQIWIRNGPFNNADSIEIGWTASPNLYGDSQARLFLYWTIDSGKSTGCFNLMCPGFVQVNSSIALGTTFSPVSKDGGVQYQISVTLLRDFDRAVWWAIYKKDVIGYWPVGIFRGLSKVGSLVLFGGDVYSPSINSKPHTSTAMGSGRFAKEHFRHACFVSKPRIVDYSFTFKWPEPGFALSTASQCYGAELFKDPGFDEALFYFGGPGRNDQCP